jgi:hypothetical protein
VIWIHCPKRNDRLDASNGVTRYTNNDPLRTRRRLHPESTRTAERSWRRSRPAPHQQSPDRRRPRGSGAGRQGCNTLGADVLASDPHEAAGQRVIFLSGDDADAKKEVVAFFEDAGFAAIDLGDLATGGEMQQIHHPLAGLNLIRP